MSEGLSFRTTLAVVSCCVKTHADTLLDNCLAAPHRQLDVKKKLRFFRAFTVNLSKIPHHAEHSSSVLQASAKVASTANLFDVSKYHPIAQTFCFVEEIR